MGCSEFCVLLVPSRYSLGIISIAWLFEIAGGAIADFEDTCVPKSQREAPFTIAALHQWEMDVDDDRCIDSAEEVRTHFCRVCVIAILDLILVLVDLRNFAARSSRWTVPQRQ